MVINYINRVDHYLSTIATCLDSSQKLYAVRCAFLRISSMLDTLCITDVNFNFQLVKDVCFFYAFTYTYFSSHEYKAFQGEKVEIRQCDISSIASYAQKAVWQSVDDRVVKTEKKSYRP